MIDHAGGDAERIDTQQEASCESEKGCAVPRVGSLKHALTDAVTKGCAIVPMQGRPGILSRLTIGSRVGTTDATIKPAFFLRLSCFNMTGVRSTCTAYIPDACQGE